MKNGVLLASLYATPIIKLWLCKCLKIKHFSVLAEILEVVWRRGRQGGHCSISPLWWLSIHSHYSLGLTNYKTSLQYQLDFADQEDVSILHEAEQIKLKGLWQEYPPEEAACWTIPHWVSAPELLSLMLRALWALRRRAGRPLPYSDPSMSSSSRQERCSPTILEDSSHSISCSICLGWGYPCQQWRGEAAQVDPWLLCAARSYSCCRGWSYSAALAVKDNPDLVLLSPQDKDEDSWQVELSHQTNGFV